MPLTLVNRASRIGEAGGGAPSGSAGRGGDARLRGAQSIDEQVLVARCLRGDPGAQRDLFRRQLSGVHATLYRILGPCRDAEDLVQETFIEVFRSLPSFRGESSVATWIDRIAAHVAYRWLSRKKPTAAPLHLVPEPDERRDPPDQRAHAREGIRRLYGILAELEPAARIAFALHAIDGRPLADVAKLVGSSLVATKVRVWRARRHVERRAAADPVLADFLARGAR